MSLQKQLSNYLWVEKYRPTTVRLDSSNGIPILLPETYRNYFLKMIKDGEIQNMLLISSTPGAGKTSLAKALCNDMECTYKYINLSSSNGIDVLRNDIQKFAAMKSLDGKPKIVIGDECLSEDEYVRVGTVDKYKSIKLKNLEKDKVYPIVSFNLETYELENDTGYIISDKDDDLYEVVLWNGKKIVATGNHPFIVENRDANSFTLMEKTIDGGLCDADRVVSIIEDSTEFTLDTIKSITPKKRKRVINLTVSKNHTFITKNGIVTHNCDGSTGAFQQGLRGFCEEFQRSCRFIFTANYASKIIEPIKSRCAVFDFNMSEKKVVSEMKPLIEERITMILEAEEIAYKPEIVTKLVDTYYPDIRQMISLCQKFSGMHKAITNDIFNMEQIGEEFFSYILEKKFRKAREYLIQNNYNYNDLYKELYDNLIPRIEVAKQMQIIILISEYMYRHAFAIDPEINAAACLGEIMGVI
jgi:DNA polymerase III delta prime subunit